MHPPIALSAVLLVAQQVHAVAISAQQTTCSGEYGTIASALRYYPLATSYCQKNHAQRACTTTITARKPTSTVVTVKEITVTAADSTTVVTVSTISTVTAVAETNTVTGTESRTVTDPTLTDTITTTNTETITPAPVGVTATELTTLTEVKTVTNTATVTLTETATRTETTTASPAAKVKRTAPGAEPTSDLTLNNPNALVARGDPRKKQWVNCLKSNPRKAISSICKCMVPAKTITTTVTPKGTARMTTTSTVYHTITHVAVQTIANVAGEIITPAAVIITSTVTLTSTITLEPAMIAVNRLQSIKGLN
ncbi:hypothetical protein BST61_g5488 [Cercospora zeina]